MKENTQLQKLYELGIPITVLARECFCSPATMYNYIHNRSIPNGGKASAIRAGLEQMLTKITEIVRE